MTTAPVLTELTASLWLDEFALPFAHSTSQLHVGLVLRVDATPARREQHWEIVTQPQLIAYGRVTARVREQTTGQEFTAWIYLGGR